MTSDSAAAAAAASSAGPEAPPMPAGMDPAYYSLSLLRRRKLDECVAVSTHHLNLNMKASVAAASPTDSSSGRVGGLDEQLWCIQTKAIILQSWFDDTEIEDDGVDDVLLEGEQAVVSTAHRPNTSLRAARLGTAGGGGGQSRAGLGTASGRPVSSRHGFARPGTLNNRPGTLNAARGGGTAVRPITGRFVRLGTASLMAVPGGPHINVQRLNLEKYARERPLVAKLLCDYLLYVEHRPKLALELCTAALKPPPTPQQMQMQQQQGAGLPLAPPGARSAVPGGSTIGLPPMRTPMAGTGQPSQPQVQLYREQAGIPTPQDWWWKERLGKSYYQLGVLREAEKHFKAALYERGGGGGGRVFDGPFGRPISGGSKKDANSPATAMAGAMGRRFVHYQTGTIMELGKVYSKMDQPLTALELYAEALDANPVDHHILLCCARLHDELHQPDKSFEYYQQVLRFDSSNVEAIACIAAHFFYERNQPELALRFYRRLLQMGVTAAENWNNIGLCAFYSSQLDFALSCFERGLALCAEDAQRADLWFNVGHVGIGLGDRTLAERAFKLAVAADPTHAEAMTNLGVLSLERERGAGKGGGGAPGVYSGASVVSSEGRRRIETAIMLAPELVEALYDSALLAFDAGELEHANTHVLAALDAFPDHAESVALQAQLRQAFLAL